MSEYIITCNKETALWIGNDVDSMRPIVRCRDCKYYYEADNYHPQGNYNRRCCKYFDAYDDEVEPDGYCAWGERKDAQFDVLEAAYDEVPIWAKKRIAELERMLEYQRIRLICYGGEVDALVELVCDMWKCLQAHIESAINDGGCGYPYSPQTCGCGESCTVNGEDCSMSLFERRMRELGIEVDG